MPSYGPIFRALVEGAAGAYAFADADDAMVFFKALGRGAALADLAPVERKEEVQAVVTAVGARAKARFDDWRRRFHAPDDEVDALLALMERHGAAALPQAAKALTPAATPRDTALALFLAIAADEPRFEEDLILRDIGWAVAKSAFSAADEYAAALKGLELSLKTG